MHGAIADALRSGSLPAPACLMSLLLLALLGCREPEPTAPPPDPRPVAARVVATLEEAVRLDREHEDAQAVRAWRRAHAAFEADLEPRLREVHADDEVALTEYAFGRVRSEIDQAGGAPGPVVRQLRDRLDAQIAPLIPPEAPES